MKSYLVHEEKCVIYKRLQLYTLSSPYQPEYIQLTKLPNICALETVIFITILYTVNFAMLEIFSFAQF